LPEIKSIDFYSFEFKDFMVIGKNNKKIGIVVEIIEKPFQSLMVVKTNSKEIFIPIHQDIILSVNHLKKEIQVELPINFFDLF
jgi:16S rRNA processing protein RimM